MALESTNPQPNVFQLPCNHKGHYIRDIVHYLTLGNSNHEGHPTIHVMEGETQSAELQTLEFHPAEFYDLHVADRVHDQEVLEKSRRQLLALHAHQHGRVDANAAASLASMCPRDQTDLPIRSHLLPACRLTMSQELHQKQVRDAITAATPKLHHGHWTRSA